MAATPAAAAATTTATTRSPPPPPSRLRRWSLSAIIGSVVDTVPVGLQHAVVVNGFAYQQCGSTWYQPQIAGSSTTYIVVNPPR